MRDTVFTLKQYKVLKKMDRYTKKIGYIIVNVKQPGFAHTHINDKNTAIILVKNCVYKHTPLTTNLYLLNSYLRVSDDKEYKAYIQDIISSIEYNVPIRENKHRFPIVQEG